MRLLSWRSAVLAGALVGACSDSHELGDAGSGEDASECLSGAPCTSVCGWGRWSCGGTRCILTEPAATGTVCRAAVGPCDWAETCDGTSLECPGDLIAPPGEICGPMDVCDEHGDCVALLCSRLLECDVGRACSEVGVIECADDGTTRCVSPGPLPEGTTCSPASSECQIEETCDGLSLDCPPDEFVPDGTPCGGGECGGGACIIREPCGTPCFPVPGRACERGVLDCSSGLHVCVPTGAAPAGMECRIQIDTCDVAEACDGTSLDCPADGFAPAGTLCAGGVCDGLGVCAI